MKFNLYTNVHAFYKDTFDILMRHEAQNMIMLGNVIIGNEGKDKYEWRDPANWLMATVTDDTRICLTALMTPPHKLALYTTDNLIDDAAISCLIEGISKTSFILPGVMTEKKLAERFVQIYNKEYEVEVEMRLFELLEVNPDIPTFGRLRHATESDLYFLPYWLENFHSEIYETAHEAPTDIEKYQHRIQRLYVLADESGIPVSIANVSREMPTACGIASVFTPPYFRGRGYASACVAMLSQQQLDKGFKSCVLYTDLANPTSNSIYMKIGYKPIADSLDIKFVVG